jgi:hypothetical protein
MDPSETSESHERLPENAAGSWREEPRLTPELRQWLLQHFNEEETLADLCELREKGGLELTEFLPELEQAVNGRDGH